MPLQRIESSEEAIECPLCLEPFEMDDLSFYPCTCGYQICRFCWHRIRTDENGLCPACRKPYAENPADFKPLTSQELAKIKAEKKQKDQAKKQKAYENRKHLQNVRVVQNNLVFVVGLPPKMADPDILKRAEYFGRFGRIHKVVLNHSNHYAGQQVSGSKSPSCSAYVTYIRSDDALRAIQAVNNFCVDGRTLKASLGTTKYCSHFMKNQSCPKADCMYLHEIGEDSASFTKEDMQLGKHQEYERKLHEVLIQTSQSTGLINPKDTRRGSTSPQLLSSSAPQLSVSPNAKSGTWPSLDTVHHNNNKGEKNPSGKLQQPKRETKSNKNREKLEPKSGFQENRFRSTSRSPIESNSVQDAQSNSSSVTSSTISLAVDCETIAPEEVATSNSDIETMETAREVPSPKYSDSPVNSPSRMPTSEAVDIPFSTDRHESQGQRQQSKSFFSSATFHNSKAVTTVPPGWSSNGSEDSGISDSLSVASNADWNLVARESNTPDPLSGPELKPDDDLGFDPFHETQKALAELVEKENIVQKSKQSSYSNMPPQSILGATQQLRSRLPPPGFNPPGFITHPLGLTLGNVPLGKNQNSEMMGSKLFPFPSSNAQQSPLFGIGSTMGQPLPQRQVEPPSLLGLNVLGLSSGYPQPPNTRPQHSHPSLYNRSQSHDKDPYTVKDWQDGLKNLFPNINITAGPGQQTHAPRYQNQLTLGGHSTLVDSSKTWRSSISDWSALDPAIVSAGQLSEGSDSPPHWLRSLEQLTESSANGQFGLHLGSSQYGQPRHDGGSWPQHVSFGNQIPTAPPPGFSHLRLQQIETQKLIDNL
ncbi:CCR4-NOT transcription complex subunit 4-like isoform X1 [Artemia franciscana]|uniref:CCR4-NOT transcription complex subunit 4 n=1 Tax=Artemia franciscana TaxID=6661 RepID=A0AA88I6S6_ARTSF|nr:hypothetical protein QYM36_001597 [Artemia franciscana]KAK2725201.1 hypothetical protein QYM36_001597 [Artemia franciscana]